MSCYNIKGVAKGITLIPFNELIFTANEKVKEMQIFEIVIDF